mgnify:CR=1 FL=1
MLSVFFIGIFLFSYVFYYTKLFICLIHNIILYNNHVLNILIKFFITYILNFSPFLCLKISLSPINTERKDRLYIIGSLQTCKGNTRGNTKHLFCNNYSLRKYKIIYYTKIKSVKIKRQLLHHYRHKSYLLEILILKQ